MLSNIKFYRCNIIFLRLNTCTEGVANEKCRLNSFIIKVMQFNLHVFTILDPHIGSWCVLYSSISCSNVCDYVSVVYYIT